MRERKGEEEKERNKRTWRRRESKRERKSHASFVVPQMSEIWTVSNFAVSSFRKCPMSTARCKED